MSANQLPKSPQPPSSSAGHRTPPPRQHSLNGGIGGLQRQSSGTDQFSNAALETPSSLGKNKSLQSAPNQVDVQLEDDSDDSQNQPVAPKSTSYSAMPNMQFSSNSGAGGISYGKYSNVGVGTGKHGSGQRRGAAEDSLDNAPRALEPLQLTRETRLEAGLSNLGNTCFMNSSLQCLLHIYPLISYFISDANPIDKKVNVNSTKNGLLALAFFKLSRDAVLSADRGSVAPRSFLQLAARFAPHLLDYSQQDSQEFLRFLLDGLSDDLCRRILPEIKKINKVPANASATSSALVTATAIESPPKQSIVNKRKEEINKTRQSNSKDDANDILWNLAQHPPQGSPNQNDSTETDIDEETASDNKSPVIAVPIADFDGYKGKKSTAKGNKTVSNETVDTDATTPVSKTSKNPNEELDLNLDSDIIIMRGAQKAWYVYMKFNDSIVSDLFSGLLQSTITCLDCGQKSYSFDPFIDMSVGLPDPTPAYGTDNGVLSKLKRGMMWVKDSNAQGDKRVSLEDCLKDFLSLETLDEENLVTCDRCKEKKRVSKQLSIYRYPRVLIIHLKRFRYNTVYRDKINTNVHFPLTGLDMTDYMSVNSPYVLGQNGFDASISKSKCEAASRKAAAANNSGSTNNNSSGNNSSNSYSIDFSDDLSYSPIQFSCRSDATTSAAAFPKPVYDLIGIANHSGGLGGGHYVAHCNTVNNSASTTSASNWKCFDDGHVSDVDAASLGGSSAYVLFYRLRDDVYYEAAP